MDLFGGASRIAVSFSVSSCCPSKGFFFPLLCFTLGGGACEGVTTSSLDVVKSKRLMSKLPLPLSRRKVRRDALDRNLCPSGLKQQENQLDADLRASVVHLQVTSYRDKIVKKTKTESPCKVDI